MSLVSLGELVAQLVCSVVLFGQWVKKCFLSSPSSVFLFDKHTLLSCMCVCVCLSERKLKVCVSGKAKGLIRIFFLPYLPVFFS